MLRQTIPLYLACEKALDVMHYARQRKHLWNLGTAVNRSGMEEIKSIRLRDNLKIHQQQT